MPEKDVSSSKLEVKRLLAASCIDRYFSQVTTAQFAPVHIVMSYIEQESGHAVFKFSKIIFSQTVKSPASTFSYFNHS